MGKRSLSLIRPANRRILIAWDVSRFDSNDVRLLHSLIPFVGGVKVGLQAFTARQSDGTIVGWEIVKFCQENNLLCFIDLKLKDITNTVVETIKNLVALDMECIVTIHGPLRYATIVAALEAAKDSKVIIAGVSLLTDHDETDAQEIYHDSVKGVVTSRAQRMNQAAVQVNTRAALVCSPLELGVVNQYRPLIKITPGIRDADSPPDDQKRTATAVEAIEAGADYLVIGRPILKANDPAAAARRFVEQIETAL